MELWTWTYLGGWAMGILTGLSFGRAIWKTRKEKGN